MNTFLDYTDYIDEYYSEYELSFTSIKTWLYFTPAQAQFRVHFDRLSILPSAKRSWYISYWSKK